MLPFWPRLHPHPPGPPHHKKVCPTDSVKYTFVKRKQYLSFLAGLVVRIILIYLEVPIKFELLCWDSGCSCSTAKRAVEARLSDCDPTVQTKNTFEKNRFWTAFWTSGLSTTIAKYIRLDKMPETLYYYWFYWSQNQYRGLPESPVLIAITVHSGNKRFIILEYELHITDILEYGEARSRCNFHEPATRSDI